MKEVGVIWQFAPKDWPLKGNSKHDPHTISDRGLFDPETSILKEQAVSEVWKAVCQQALIVAPTSNMIKVPVYADLIPSSNTWKQ